MRFKADSERANQIQDLIEQCEVSLEKRTDSARRIRRYVLYGSDEGRYSRYNKIYHALRLKSSYLFSARRVQFAITPPPGSDPKMAERTEEASAHLSMRFNESTAPEVFTQGVFWGLAYGTMLAKFGWNGALQCWPVEPAAFGVQRESVINIQNQEAVSLRFYSSKSEVERALRYSGRSDEDIINLVKRLHLYEPGQESPVPDNFIGRLIVSQTSPTTIGAVAGLGQPMAAAIAPETSEELVEMRELRAYDDDLRDWRVFTIALPDIVLFDRPQKDLDIANLLPYAKISPNPVYDYFWGASEGEMLAPLQEWREKRMNQLDKLFARQVNPPGVAKNFVGLTDEKYAAAFRKGGVISSNNPSATLEPLYPQLPPESFAEIQAIDSMFDATLGLPPVLQGQEPAGGKGSGGLSIMVQMASAPIVNQALEIERSLSQAGRVIFRILRKQDNTVLTTDDGVSFTMGLLPENCSVSVAAHSSSPMFSSELKSEAAQMLEFSLIDGQTYVEMTEPPSANLIIERMKKRSKEEADQKEQALKLLISGIQQAPPDQKGALLERMFEYLTGAVPTALRRSKKK